MLQCTVTNAMYSRNVQLPVESVTAQRNGHACTVLPLLAVHSKLRSYSINTASHCASTACPATGAQLSLAAQLQLKLVS
jgi:hypothetical protein